jgi:DNA helicase-2/ATP-dependent DNA helicase PcrA
MEGCNKYKDIKQVVIDESQDYYPIHFEILKSLFSKARYTILGDINQTIEKQEDISFYKDIQKILQKDKSTIVSMNKSFRCTNEIISFSSQFIDGDYIIESFNRKGEVPKVLEIENEDILENTIVDEVMEYKSQGYNSIGILCKSGKEAKVLYERINNKIELKLIDENSQDGIDGVFVIPIYMAKGLEFDAVIISGVDDENYRTEDDKKLLYVGSTRALHRLSIFYTGTKSQLIK